MEKGGNLVTGEPSPAKIRTARFVALAADFVQVVAFPTFGAGALSPWNDALDVVVGAVLIWLVGWHWAFLPSFVSELIPVWDLVPSWTAAVFLATRGKPSEAAGPAK